MTTHDILLAAAAAKPAMAAARTEAKNRALLCMADELEASAANILTANAADLAAARGLISDVMLDRLRLTEERIAGMAKGIRDAAALPDPVGALLSETVRPNGLRIRKVSAAMGVIAMIYESRPNVTSDAAALCLKAGSVCVLRCGKEAHASCAAVTAALRAGLAKAGLPRDAVQLVEDTSRDSARELMTASGLVDLLIPRGGKGLIDACVAGATVPCIQTGTGICHIYADESCDIAAAVDIIANAKASRPSVCNAAEVLLVHRAAAPELLPALRRRLVAERAARGLPQVELRLCPEALAVIPGAAAAEGDYDTEFLDYVLAVKIVGSVEEAAAHIAAHSTHHSEAILTRDEAAAAYFTSAVDSAAVYVNASTRFTDGGEFGLGCEMGISTQKLHARGPMGLAELCSYKYVVLGDGQIR